MKKSTIWILTIVMALTFIGLLYMQFMYMEEMVKMREQHFAEGVKRSLYSLSTALEKNETKRYLEDELLMVEPGFLDSKMFLKSDHRIGDDLSDAEEDYALPLERNPIERDKIKKFQETLRRRYLYQKELINEVVLTILNQSSGRLIQERADTSLVNTYLRAELGNNGIDLGWEYAVVDRKGRVVCKTKGYDVDTDKNEIFTQTLFPNDTEIGRASCRERVCQYV